MGDEEVSRRSDLVGVEVGVGEPDRAGHQDRIRDLVELDAERVGRAACR